MRRALMICLAAICLTTLVQAKVLDDHTDYAMNRFIVKVWKDAGSLDPNVVNGIAQTWDQELSALNQKWHVVSVERLFREPADDKIADQYELPTFWRFWFAKDVSRDELEAVVTDFSGAKLVQSAEPIGIHPVTDYLPNDPLWPNQWHLINSTGDHDIDAPQGWDLERGDTVAIFGVTDTGVRFTHTDLAAHIWKNWAEVRGAPGVDDDGNGFVDDSLGWDFVTGVSGCASGEDCNTPDNNPSDVAGHGTHVAGIAAAVTNNNNGVCGIAGGGTSRLGARIMPLRIGWEGSDGRGYIGMDFAAQAINYGRVKGVTVFNCSWGSSGLSALVAAVTSAVGSGISFTVAAGNDNTSSQSSNYLSTRGDCIDVAATDNTDTRASFSNFGTWVDVSAPGVNVYSTFNGSDDSYAYLSGTSMAAPCVAGEVLLLKSQHPAWTRSKIDTCIKNHTDNIDALNPGYAGQLGTGRINIYLALLTNAISLQVTSPNGGEGWFLGETHNITWIPLGFAGNVKIELNRSYPGGTWEVLFANTANDGSEPWTVSGALTSFARIRVSSINTPTISDVSDAEFGIATQFISISSPNGGEGWYIGDARTIFWSSGGFTGNVRVQLNRSYPSATWEDIAPNAANDGSEPWTVSGPVSAAARVRVVSITMPTVGDTSNSNFTIMSPTITVNTPNGGEAWYVGETHGITWNSSGVPGTVKIELNRAYSGGTWELLFDNISNSGTQAWIVSGAAATTARIRVSSYANPSINDVSNANFTIAVPYLHVDAPNGGETWPITSVNSILWSSGGVPGNVLIQLNRTYPSGSWDSLFVVAANFGSQNWTVAGPITSLARVRITSLNNPGMNDVSDANFTVQGQPPVLTHDPLGDFVQSAGTVTATAYSPQLSIATVKMFYRLTGNVGFDSLQLTATGNPNECAASLSFLPVGTYQYYVRAADIASLTTFAPASAPAAWYSFDVSVLCGTSLAYDDGSADKFSWSDGTPGVTAKWAVKFGPVTTPFVLCAAQFAASRSLPDAAHSPVHVYVYAADGAGGLPGTLIQDVVTGSVGNVIGGLPTGTNWAWAFLKDDVGQPLVVNTSQFYVALGNDSLGKYESFGRDTTGANAHRSYFFDPCPAQWYSEDAVGNSNAHPGNRMIRSFGYSITTPNVVIYRSNNQINLSWTNTHAPTYTVFVADYVVGPYSLLQTTSDTTLTVTTIGAADMQKFYQVVSSTP